MLLVFMACHKHAACSLLTTVQYVTVFCVWRYIFT